MEENTYIMFNNNTNINININTRFIERRGSIASEALADRSIQFAKNRREKRSFKSSFK